MVSKNTIIANAVAARKARNAGRKDKDIVADAVRRINSARIELSDGANVMAHSRDPRIVKMMKDIVDTKRIVDELWKKVVDLFVELPRE